MNKSDIITIVANKLNITQKESESCIDAFLETICEGLENDEKVVVSGFGTFEVRQRVSRNGRNPRTGEEIVIPGQKSPGFKAGKLLKEAVKK